MLMITEERCVVPTDDDPSTAGVVPRGSFTMAPPALAERLGAAVRKHGALAYVVETLNGVAVLETTDVEDPAAPAEWEVSAVRLAALPSLAHAVTGRMGAFVDWVRDGDPTATLRGCTEAVVEFLRTWGRMLDPDTSLAIELAVLRRQLAGAVFADRFGLETGGVLTGDSGLFARLRQLVESLAPLRQILAARDGSDGLALGDEYLHLLQQLVAWPFKGDVARRGPATEQASVEDPGGAVRVVGKLAAGRPAPFATGRLMCAWEEVQVRFEDPSRGPDDAVVLDTPAGLVWLEWDEGNATWTVAGPLAGVPWLLLAIRGTARTLARTGSFAGDGEDQPGRMVEMKAAQLLDAYVQCLGQQRARIGSASEPLARLLDAMVEQGRELLTFLEEPGDFARELAWRLEQWAHERAAFGEENRGIELRPWDEFEAVLCGLAILAAG